MDSLFDQEDTVLTKKITGEKSIFQSYGVPKGTVIAINSSGEILTIKKPAIVYPRYDGSELVINELDRNMNLEEISAVLAVLITKIKDLSTIALDDLTSRSFEKDNA